jgi:hypothetical protein
MGLIAFESRDSKDTSPVGHFRDGRMRLEKLG